MATCRSFRGDTRSQTLALRWSRMLGGKRGAEVLAEDIPSPVAINGNKIIYSHRKFPVPLEINVNWLPNLHWCLWKPVFKKVWMSKLLLSITPTYIKNVLMVFSCSLCYRKSLWIAIEGMLQTQANPTSFVRAFHIMRLSQTNSTLAPLWTGQ